MSTLNGGPGNIVTNGLVLYLDAANYLSYTSGSTTWRDLTSSNLSGSLINGPTYTSANAGAIVFDGVDDYVNISSSNNINLFSQNEVTLEIFIKCTPTNSGRLISSELSDYTTPYLLYFNTDKPTFFLSTNSPNSYIDLKSTITINNSSYYHIVATYNNSLAIIYINGIFNIQGAYSKPIYNPGINGYVYLMASKFSVTNQWLQAGNLPVTRIYNRALTATEVLQNYNAQKTRFGLT